MKSISFKKSKRTDIGQLKRDTLLGFCAISRMVAVMQECNWHKCLQHININDYYKTMFNRNYSTMKHSTTLQRNLSEGIKEIATMNSACSLQAKQQQLYFHEQTFLNLYTGFATQLHGCLTQNGATKTVVSEKFPQASNFLSLFHQYFYKMKGRHIISKAHLAKYLSSNKTS